MPDHIIYVNKSLAEKVRPLISKIEEACFSTINQCGVEVLPKDIWPKIIWLEGSCKNISVQVIAHHKEGYSCGRTQEWMERVREKLADHLRDVFRQEVSLTDVELVVDSALVPMSMSEHRTV